MEDERKLVINNNIDSDEVDVAILDLQKTKKVLQEVETASREGREISNKSKERPGVSRNLWKMEILLREKEKIEPSSWLKFIIISHKI